MARSSIHSLCLVRRLLFFSLSANALKSGWSYTIRRLDRPSANLSENHPGESSLKTSRVIPSASMTFLTREISRLEHPKAEEISSIACAIQAQCHDLLEAGHKRPSPPIIEVDTTPPNSDAANHNYETKPPPLPPTRKPPTNNADTTYHLPRIDNARIRSFSAKNFLNTASPAGAELFKTSLMNDIRFKIHVPKTHCPNFKSKTKGEPKNFPTSSETSPNAKTGMVCQQFGSDTVHLRWKSFQVLVSLTSLFGDP